MTKFLIVIGMIFELISGQPHRELIKDISNPQQVFWRDMDHVIFVKESDIFEFDIVEKTLRNIGSREPNEFVGLDNDKNIVLCKIEHFLIDSEDEFSTIFTINGKVIKIFPTIRPISLKEDTIVAMTALDFLEQHYYEISIANGEIKEIEKPKNISDVKDKTLYIQKDIVGNLYLNYDTRRLLKYAIRILKHQLDLALKL
jgi:hypothetical protein